MLQLILYVLIFLTVVVIFANVRSRIARQICLVAASYALYLTWGYWFPPVLLLSTSMNYFLGKWVRRKPSASVLWISILPNLALLATLKYLPETGASLPFAPLHSFVHLALPLGISFWTFQAISYLADLYRGEDLDPSLLEFALYMVFFPVVISGPVCRMPDMLPQFRSERPVFWTDRKRGFMRIATGVLMMQLAKLLGQGILSGDGINSGFDYLTHWSGLDVWCLAVGYGLQLFLDFAGYSHIAIGAAKALGITVPENFHRPFESTSPSIFWTRWHMSLSFWIRDYVFLPLAVLRPEVWWRNLALIIAMALFGVWHKATVLFLLWGLYHGVLLVLHRLFQQVQRKFDWSPQGQLWDAASWIVTIAVISLGWIFFRAKSFDQAARMLASVFSPGQYVWHFLSGSLYFLEIGMAIAYASVVASASALDRYSVEEEGSAQHGSPILNFLARKRWFWVAPLYGLALLLVLIVTLTQSAGTAQFMYRQF